MFLQVFVNRVEEGTPWPLVPGPFQGGTPASGLRFFLGATPAQGPRSFLEEEGVTTSQDRVYSPYPPPPPPTGTARMCGVGSMQEDFLFL